MPQSLINEFKAISGCVLLIDPQTITGLADAASITAITDQSENGSTIGLPAGTKPTWKANPYAYTGRPAIRMASTNGSGLTVTGLTLPGNTGHTYIMVCRPDRITSALNRTIFGTTGNAPNIYARQAVNRLTIFQGSGKEFGPGAAGNPSSFSGAGGTYQFQNDWNIVIVRASGTTTAFRGYLNGESTTVAKTSISDITTLYVGMLSDGTLAYGGDIGFVAAYNVEITDQQVTDLAAHLRRAFPLSPAPKGKTSFQFIGDSITHGNSATLRTSRWAALALSQATAIDADYRRAVEVGIPSAQVTGLEAAWNGTGGFKTWIPSDAVNPVYVVWAGTNDVGIGSQTGAAVNTRLETFAATIKAYNAAAKVVVVTMLPRASVTTVRGDLNTLLMADTTNVSGILYTKDAGNFDYILAIHENTTIGEDGDNDNATNYNTDDIHPNTTGHGIIANEFDGALETLYALSSGAPTVTAVAVADTPCTTGETVTLAATTSVTGGASQSVTWEIVSGSGSANASTGVFDAAGLAEGATAVVRARSIYDPFYSDTATITVVAAETSRQRAMLGGLIMGARR
jgi:lysophospholipase L1-like esterase